ncbi:MAG: GNAT family N-acetyltransferase [Humibacter sp.]
MGEKNLGMPRAKMRRGELRYRPIMDSDGPALFRLFQQICADEIATLAADAETRDALASMQYVEQHMRNRAQFPDAVDLAIEYNGVLCGRLLTVMRGRGLQLVQLCVLREYRGKGIGTSAMRRLSRIAEEHGCRIWLPAGAGTQDCRGFLERVGFTVTGHDGRLVVTPRVDVAA